MARRDLRRAEREKDGRHARNKASHIVAKARSGCTQQRREQGGDVQREKRKDPGAKEEGRIQPEARLIEGRNVLEPKDIGQHGAGKEDGERLAVAQVTRQNGGEVTADDVPNTVNDGDGPDERIDIVLGERLHLGKASHKGRSKIE